MASTPKDPTPTPQPWKRGYKGALFDRLITRITGLPHETGPYTITPVQIPITDPSTTPPSTFHLLADLYQPVPTPTTTSPKGTILSWGPYGRGIGFANLCARQYACRGYNALLISSRGTYGSGSPLAEDGKTRRGFEPFAGERVDARGILEWLKGQGWYLDCRDGEGKRRGFVGFGPSYLGFTQWALLSQDGEGKGGEEREMKAAIMITAAHDMARWVWGESGGALNVSAVLWAEMIVRQREEVERGGEGGFWSFARQMWTMLTALERLKPVFESVPLKGAVERLLGRGRADWLTEGIMMRRDWEGDGYYDMMRYTGTVDSVVGRPILLVGGWQDVFLEQTMEQYRRLSRRGQEVRLVVGPWTHSAVMGHEMEPWNWMERCFGHQEKPEGGMPVRVFVGGVDEWRDMPMWPPAGREMVELYLKSDKKLGFDETSGVGSSSFVYDPVKPTPTVGGAMLGSSKGSVNDSSLAIRPDVLTFTTAPLDKDVEVMGTPSIQLLHESDNPHVDIFFRLSQVDCKGQSKNITEGYKRLDPKRGPDEIPELLTLEMKDCAHVFKKGTCLRLIVAGSSSSWFHRNPGTEGEDGNAVLATELRSATHTVHHRIGGIGEGGRVSRFILPVVAK